MARSARMAHRIAFGVAVASVLLVSDAIAGASAYYYFTKYRSDNNAALQDLRRKEFRAGRYDPALSMHDKGRIGIQYMFQFKFPPTEQSIAPGARHASISAALNASGADGTRSILDIVGISEKPKWFHANPLPKQLLTELFGTDQPNREKLEAVLFTRAIKLRAKVSRLFWDRIARGTARYIVTFKGIEPDQIFFVGFSVD